MADVAIVNTSVTAAPNDYTVPGTNDLRVKAVRASLDGSGTASSWLPALQLLDPAGHVMWTAVDPSTSVAAAGSADVSWFPGVKGTGASTATATLSYGFAHTNSWLWPQTFAQVVDFSLGTISSNDTATIGIGSGSDPLTILKAGVYFTHGQVGPYDPAWGNTGVIDLGGTVMWSFTTSGSMPTREVSTPTYTSVGGKMGWLESWGVGVVAAGDVPFTQRIQAQQTSGSDRTVRASLFVLRLGDA